MKKLVSVFLAVVMVLGLSLALADEVPQPENGKKFEGDWAIRCGIVQINYEEEGYRVYLELYNQEAMTGEVWMYNCYYVENLDALESISSTKYTYTINPETYERINNGDEYEGFDDENSVTTFAINENGKLTWADGHENAGADLEFQPIGNFNGVWENEAEDVAVEISWEGLNDEENFFYVVFIRRGEVDFNMHGLYNWETGKLEASGTATTWVDNGEGGYDPVEDPETYDAFFSMQENGKLLFETDNGIELEYTDVSINNG